jgi:hypothetical protein
MIGSVLTWITVPVPSFVHKGLGLNHTTSSEGARAPLRSENSHHQQVIKHEGSGINNKDSQRQETRSDFLTDDCDGIGSCPLNKSTMSKSRPSSRRQSNVGGMFFPPPDVISIMTVGFV